MKYFLILLLFFLINCSFDNKSGIWKNSSNQNNIENSSIFKDFKKVTLIKKDTFNEIIKFQGDYTFSLNSIQNTQNWNEAFYNKSNTYVNFAYNNANKILFKSKKLTKHLTRDKVLFSKDFFITTDIKGNIIFYSVKNKKIVRKFNFYKNKFKSLKKNLNLVIYKDIIYVSDNLGYYYSYNYLTDKIIWAKNYKIPLRSNIKITKDKVIFADQNNNLIFVNKSNGEIIKRIPTEEVLVKSFYQNTLAIGNNNLFFLNIFGSLYSINLTNYKINWVLNLNESLEIDLSNLFEAKIIKFSSDKLIISTNNSLYVINSFNGSNIYKFPIIGKIEPLITNEQIFIVTKNDLLVCIDLTSGKIIYSYDINKKIANFLKIKKNKVNVRLTRLVNDKIYVYLKNSYIIKFSLDGEIKIIQKLPDLIKSDPIFINRSMLYLNKNNKLIIYN